MKNLLLYSLLTCCLLGACATDKAPETITAEAPAKTEVIELAPAEFASKSKNGILLDVRTPEEVAAGTIKGALAMDFKQSDFLAQVTELPKDREIYLYCAVGGRSGKAAELLIAQGYTKVYNLQGGLTAWTAAGLPITISE